MSDLLNAKDLAYLELQNFNNQTLLKTSKEMASERLVAEETLKLSSLLEYRRSDDETKAKTHREAKRTLESMKIKKYYR